MRSVDSSIYTKKYYLNDCNGFEEFKKYKGSKTYSRLEEIMRLVNMKKGMKVLDIGCGRGDYVLYCARKGAMAVGIDYSVAGIKLANEARNHQDNSVKKNIKFICGDIKKLPFKDNSFDLVISIDVFEHVYPEELEVIMKEISRVLRPKGLLLAHTEANKIYLDFVHRVYVYPVSLGVLFLYNLITGKKYPGIPKDPRNELHKHQHVNEPTYMYLKKLFNRYRFEGRIKSHVGVIKPVLSWKDTIYNVVVALYPLSLIPPLIYFFAYDYFCLMKNNK